MVRFFNLTGKQTFETLGTSLEGLTSIQAQKKLEEHGENTLAEKKRKSILEVFLEQFKDLLVLILIAAAVISLLSGNIESTVVIFIVIILNALLGTFQHFKAAESLESLKALSAPTAKVLRDGQKVEIPSKSIVPGDIVMLEAGDLVSADGRIVENFSLQINESSLTGESESVNKTDDILSKEEVSLGDQINMVFAGSLVTYGRATVAVTGTGMHTEIGKIASLMNETQEKKTPLQVSLDEFSKKLAFIILAICAVVFGLSVYRQMPILDSLMFAVALAVAAIPEALSSIVTIVLALGTQKMAKENAIMKELKAVESLGSVSIICSDKTGTLTQNKMTTRDLYVDGKVIDSTELNLSSLPEDYLLKASVLCNDSITNEGKEIGDPTEVALVNLAEKYAIDEIKMRQEIGRVGEIPFDSDRKLMSTLHRIDGKLILFTKGACDVLFGRLDYIHTSEEVRKITQDDLDNAIAVNEEFSKNGLRVLGFAYKVLEENKILGLEDENNYIFLGLISMIDPPRAESAEAVKNCKRAGIKPIMITGDHKVTASSIAKQIGILNEGEKALEGLELDKLGEKELDEVLDNISVYARVSPEHKIRIVDAWQRKGEIVAMTGDGVNDAPALKKADIGIAMGITGTEVSKDAASMILTDDNFATIVKAITNGRNVYNNIKNAIHFLLSGNTAGILAVLYTSLFALPIPFAAVQLLFINLVTDSLPAIAIGLEKADHDLLDHKPRNPKESILNKDFLKQIITEGMLIAIATMIAFHIGLLSNTAHTASTMAFATLCLARLFHGFNCRSSKSIFKLGLLTNKYSVLAFIAGFLLLNAVLFIGFMQSLFETVTLNGSQVIQVFVLAFIPTIIIQAFKILVQQFKKDFI
jgi:Ca2+-transporting ATPase